MNKIFPDVISAIGRTPVIRLNNCVPKSQHSFYGKVEFFNPGGSVKDRIGFAIIEDAEKRGLLKPGGTIVEATSGNTGVGLAMVAALKGYKCIFVMPEKMSEEKRAILRAYGARVVLTPTGVEADDPRSHYSVARRFVETMPNAFLANQYHNPANAAIHYKTTGPELWEQTEGKIDVFVGGAGTGGTLSGVGRYLKEKNPDVKIVCADPFGSILFDLFYHKEIRTPPHSYLVEGIGEDMIPENVHFDVMDDFVQVGDAELFKMTREITRKEGLLVGPSCGAALVAAVRYAESGKLKNPSMIVSLFPDGGRSYLSKAYNDDWMRANNLLPSLIATFKVSDLLSHVSKTRKAGQMTADQIGVKATLKEAAQQFRQNGLTQLTVIENGEIRGVVEVSDVLHSLAKGRLRPEEPVIHLLNASMPEITPSESLTTLEEKFVHASHVRVKEANVVIARADLADYLSGIET